MLTLEQVRLHLHNRIYSHHLANGIHDYRELHRLDSVVAHEQLELHPARFHGHRYRMLAMPTSYNGNINYTMHHNNDAIPHGYTALVDENKPCSDAIPIS